MGLTEMAYFLVSYDLPKKGEGDYQALWDEFDRIKGVKTQESVYLVELNNTQQEVLESFKTYIHKDDLLCVVEFQNRPSYTKGLSGTNAWLTEHFG